MDEKHYVLFLDDYEGNQKRKYERLMVIGVFGEDKIKGIIGAFDDPSDFLLVRDDGKTRILLGLATERYYRTYKEFVDRGFPAPPRYKVIQRHGKKMYDVANPR